jgi:5-methylcytosine-specific restriction endonuclease McrA
MRDYPSNWNELRNDVFERDDWQCRNCGRQVRIFENELSLELHCHHIVPLSKGGTNSRSNLVALCKDCHTAVHSDKFAPTAHTSYREKSHSNILYTLYKTYKKYRRLF